MPSIAPLPGSAPQDAPCPVCDLPSEGSGHIAEGVATVNYLCPAGHIFLTKWAVA